MGAHSADYVRAAPEHSFIHVDWFAGPRELALYLLLLDRQPTLYNEYFAWKGLGHFVDTRLPCRLCLLAHLSRLSSLSSPSREEGRRGWFTSSAEWFAGPNSCSADTRWTPPIEQSDIERRTFDRLT